MARANGFVQRKSKLTADVFLQSLVLNNLDYSSLTLQEICCKLQAQYDVDISKQGLDQRFNREAVNFLKAALSLKLSRQISAETLECWKHFKAVKIKDSTRFTAPPTLAMSHPSHGSGGHKAGLSIAYEFDIKSGKVIDLSIHPSIRQDHVDAQKSLATVEPQELLIRDLGFISVGVLTEIQNRGAFFVNRLHSNTIIYEMSADRFVRMDYAKLYRFMQKKGLARIEKQVYIGDQQKLPVRMVLELLPDEVVGQRLRKMNHKAKRSKWNLSKDYVNKARFNLFITNVGADVLPCEKIRNCYRLRWQIELMFKVWKSTFRIHALKSMNVNRYLCHLYAKLLWVIINRHIFHAINLYSWRKSNRLLSMMKTFNHLNNSVHTIEIALLKQDAKSFSQQLGNFFSFVIKNLFLEEKKNKIGLTQLLMNT